MFGLHMNAQKHSFLWGNPKRFSTVQRKTTKLNLLIFRLLNSELTRNLKQRSSYNNSDSFRQSKVACFLYRSNGPGGRSGNSSLSFIASNDVLSLRIKNVAWQLCIYSIEIANSYKILLTLLQRRPLSFFWWNWS